MKMQLLADLLESHDETISQLSEEIYKIAEARVADTASDQQGNGFTREAIGNEVNAILHEINHHIVLRLKANRF